MPHPTTVRCPKCGATLGRKEPTRVVLTPAAGQEVHLRQGVVVVHCVCGAWRAWSVRPAPRQSAC